MTRPNKEKLMMGFETWDKTEEKERVPMTKKPSETESLSIRSEDLGSEPEEEQEPRSSSGLRQSQLQEALDSVRSVCTISHGAIEAALEHPVRTKDKG
jgi:hypothetical protein